MLKHLEHLKTLHHHARHAGHAFLVKAAEHHPILTSALALVGGATILYKTMGSGSSSKTTATAPVPASVVQ